MKLNAVQEVSVPLAIKELKYKIYIYKKQQTKI